MQLKLTNWKRAITVYFFLRIFGENGEHDLDWLCDSKCDVVPHLPGEGC